MAFFMEECANAYHRWRTRALPTAVTTKEKRNHKSLMKNAAYAGIPWRMCSTILSGCSALAQTKYLQRHNNAFKILFLEVLRSLDLITEVEP